MTLEQQLHEAETALSYSVAALKTHGHQGITWAALKADGERVQELRAEIARQPSGATPTKPETVKG